MPDSILKPPDGFTELTKSEQVEYLQLLWDQISEHPDEIPVRESHIRLIEQRLQRYRAEAEASRSAFDVIDRLSQKR